MGRMDDDYYVDSGGAIERERVARMKRKRKTAMEFICPRGLFLKPKTVYNLEKSFFPL